MCPPQEARHIHLSRCGGAGPDGLVPADLPGVSLWSKSFPPGSTGRRVDSGPCLTLVGSSDVGKSDAGEPLSPDGLPRVALCSGICRARGQGDLQLRPRWAKGKAASGASTELYLQSVILGFIPSGGQPVLILPVTHLVESRVLLATQTC